MRIFYHKSDDDGRCAAAIISTLYVAGDTDVKKFYGVDHNTSANNDVDVIPIEEYEEFQENEIVYIVDLALDAKIDKVIRAATAVGCKIVHIDHHKTSLDEYEVLRKDPAWDIIKVYYHVFIDTEHSASLLAWIYTSMPEGWNNLTSSPYKNVDYDVCEDTSSFWLIKEDTLYHVPMVIRYIDDNDIWRHQFDETKFFSLGFNIVGDKRPSNFKLWEKLLYSNASFVELKKYISDGEAISTYMHHDKLMRLRDAFTCTIEGMSFLCLNEGYGNSRIFDKYFDDFDGVIKFAYNGMGYKYTAYASDKRDPNNEYDMSIIACKFGGGGHAHACGWSTSNNIFETDYVSDIKPFEI